MKRVFSYGFGSNYLNNMFTTTLLTVFCYCELFHSVYMQSPGSFGGCPDHPTVNDLNLEKVRTNNTEILFPNYVCIGIYV